MSLIVATKGDVTHAGKGVQAVHMLFMMTLDMELYTFMTLKLEECLGGNLQTSHLPQCLCCVSRCMIRGYIALLNVMLKRNFPNMFPAQVLSHLPIMGT